MEAASLYLQPYKDTIGTLASVVTIGQFFTGVFICRDVYKQKSTRNISCTPFVGGAAIGILMLKYAQLLGDPAMLQVNVAAIVINSLYLAFYFTYSRDRWEEIYKPAAACLGLIAVLYGYSEMESKEVLEFRYGLIVTVLMLALLGAPLSKVGTIIENEDASSIPLPMTFISAIVSLLWLLYGIILMNIFMMVQNFLGFVLCFIQLILIFIYPEPRDKRD